MTDRVAAALEAFSQLRRAPAYLGLAPHARNALDEQIGLISRTLQGRVPREPATGDAYASLLGTPDDLQRDLSRNQTGGTGSGSNGGSAASAPPSAPSPPP